MTIFRTESEAWEAIADTIEMLGSMPPYAGSDDPIIGLCAVVTALEHDHLIGPNTEARMHLRLLRETAAARIAGTNYGAYIYPPHAWRSRLALARRFAGESKTLPIA